MIILLPAGIGKSPWLYQGVFLKDIAGKLINAQEGVTKGLSLSKRRDYAEHIGTAKREETRQQRLEQAIPMILEGIGRNDKYIKK